VELLVLGGTVWLGHEIASQAVAAGHVVTCLTRGPGVPAGARHVAADRDDDDAMASVRQTRWDAVVDVARQPGHVRRAARDLEPVAGHYVFVSSGSVYASQAVVGADEDDETLPALRADAMASLADYGAAKVACEDAVRSTFGPRRAAILRAGLIGGPGDPTGRTDYWPTRFARPAVHDGSVLVPDMPDLPVSVIDVRDLARWILHCADHAVSGVFNAFGDPTVFPFFIAACRAAADHTGPVVLAGESWLVDQGVQPWSGPRSLPLWLADRDWYGMNARSNARAIGSGLVLRPLEQTLADAMADRLAGSASARGGAGLSDDEERVLLSHLRNDRA
jgi:nucleoside-diphosphate-sugar epimerase